MNLSKFCSSGCRNQNQASDFYREQQTGLRFEQQTGTGLQENL